MLNRFQVIFMTELLIHINLSVLILILNSNNDKILVLVQGFVNSKRYYGLFEIIRSGAEAYYENTQRNFFNDFLLVHNGLGLTHIHGNATIVFSLVSRFFINQYETN